MDAMAVYGYARVSTSRQAEEGESLDVQQRTLAGYAFMHGLTVDRMFVERGVSGSVPLADRPLGTALLAALKPGDVLITPKLDRMFRSALDALGVLAKLKITSADCPCPRLAHGRRHAAGDPGCAGDTAREEVVLGCAPPSACRPSAPHRGRTLNQGSLRQPLLRLPAIRQPGHTGARSPQERRHNPPLRHRLGRVQAMPVSTIAHPPRPTAPRTMEPANGPMPRLQ
jgi:hypothetical protein